LLPEGSREKRLLANASTVLRAIGHGSSDSLYQRFDVEEQIGREVFDASSLLKRKLFRC
jgi:hypothetical protein